MTVPGVPFDVSRRDASNETRFSSVSVEMTELGSFEHYTEITTAVIEARCAGGTRWLVAWLASSIGESILYIAMHRVASLSTPHYHMP